MTDFVMVMFGTGTGGDWDIYIERLIQSGKFRGGSSLGKGVSVSKEDGDGPCQISGYMRFSAENIDEVRGLLAGNPLYESGGRVEILEEVLG